MYVRIANMMYNFSVIWGDENISLVSLADPVRTSLSKDGYSMYSSCSVISIVSHICLYCMLYQLSPKNIVSDEHYPTHLGHKPPVCLATPRLHRLHIKSDGENASL